MVARRSYGKLVAFLCARTRDVAAAEDALAEIVDADAFFGNMTPELLAASTRLRWVQSPTASL